MLLVCSLYVNEVVKHVLHPWQIHKEIIFHPTLAMHAANGLWASIAAQDVPRWYTIPLKRPDCSYEST